ncbi:serine hydrolase domain-containing protein [Sphingomicrobium arenosum]|uniref:serine hydrolase domain-containing protein n=1 Tax=Sphingomicrobium arenosum TaxID=2233861 RepID=UPI002240FCAC|nr:serine hydrolase domain-containing protein [Sphingomicrobium arenosum]
MQLWKMTAAIALAAGMVTAGGAAMSQDMVAEEAPGAYRFADKTSLDRRIEELRADYGAAAVVAAAAHGDAMIYGEGFGWADRASRTRADLDTIFAMASVTKPFTATAIMMLVEEGKVALDAPVNRYIPDHPVRSRFGDEDMITVERVLRHTAGLPLVYDLVYQGDDVVVRDFGALMDDHGYTVFPAGGSSEYSNLGYEILAEIVRRRSGMGYGAFLKKRIFEPLGLDSGFVAAGYDRPEGVATRYLKSGEAALPVDTAHPGAASLHLSVRDLLTFGQFFVRAWNGQSPLLSQASARAMASNETGEFAAGAGMGLFLEDYKGWMSAGHGGSMVGTKTRLHMFPEQGYVFVMAANRKEGWLETWTIEEMIRSFAPEHNFYWTPIRVPEALAGTRWTGMIGGNETLASLSLDFSDADHPRAFVGGKPVDFRSIQLGDRFAFKLDGELDVARTGYPHSMSFKLLERGEGYVGEVRLEQLTSAERDWGGVGYWVELRPVD